MLHCQCPCICIPKVVSAVGTFWSTAAVGSCARNSVMQLQQMDVRGVQLVIFAEILAGSLLYVARDAY